MRFNLGIGSLFFIMPMLSGCGADKCDTCIDTDEVPETGVEDSGDDVLDCEDEFVAGLDWFEQAPTASLPGQFSFAQTHVIDAEESRHAPPVISGRESLVIFSPDESLDEDLDVRMSVWQGEELLGTLPLRPPSAQPEILEQALTEEPLEPYSERGWSATLPWYWVAPDIKLLVGAVDSSGSGDLAIASHLLSELGAPHRFTVTRSKIVLFGDELFDTSTVPASEVAVDYYGSLPVAELRWVDTSDWVLGEMVVPTSNGYEMVASEGERLSVTTESNRWSLIKHQFALRMSAANTGRGLVLNDGWEGDSSPYSFGTSVVMGWVVDDNGSASDIDDAGVAAGWTGWTAMWNYECGNAFIHEVGHSATLAHFTTGTANSWGIADEYPNDGQNMSSHPWGYDTGRRLFRTWYRVDPNGPVSGDDEGLNGKYDPMNGGEPSNSVTCFPQYTAVYAEQIQGWTESSPTIAVVDGVAGSWLWNEDNQSYEEYEVDSSHQAVTLVDVPVVTLIGTISGFDEDARQIYPPIFSNSGNVFELPDPEDQDLDNEFEGARWFVEVEYDDGDLERALIAVGEVAETDMKLFSLNLSGDRLPVTASLLMSPTGWPSVDVASSELVYTLQIDTPEASELPSVVTAGRGNVANGGLVISQICTSGLDCDDKSSETTWREDSEQIYFRDRNGEVGEGEDCLVDGDFSVINIPIMSEGLEQNLIVYGQRQLRSGENSFSIPLNDRTPWIEGADISTSLALWVPIEENSHLPAGDYKTDSPYVVDVFRGGIIDSQINIEVDITLYNPIAVDLIEDGLTIGPISQEDSAVYFIVEDSTMGPTGGVWWDNYTEGPEVLRAPVIDEDTGEVVLLRIDAYKQNCDGWWDFNAAQGSGAGACDNFAVLYPSADNSELTPGHTYVSPEASPLVIHGMRWHSPDPYTIVESFPLKIRYTAP
jgi:hypothetical protein